MKLRKIILSLSAVLAATALYGQVPPCDTLCKDNRFTFVQISDPQLGFREENGFAEGEALLVKTVEAINLLHPAFVIVTGDMVNSAQNKEQTSAYSELIGQIDQTIPVYHIPGNHDMGKSTPAHRQAYINAYGYDRFAFTYGGCRFIGIDSCPIKDNDAEAEAEQYRWLEEQLREGESARRIFVFMHCPIVVRNIDEEEGYSNFSTPMRLKYTALFERYGVDAVFAGHLHNTARCRIGTTELFTTGPSGKPLGNGYSGLAVINVDAETYGYSFVTAESIIENLNK